MIDILSYPQMVKLKKEWEPYVLENYPQFGGELIFMGARDGMCALKNQEGNLVSMSEAYLRRSFELVEEESE